MLGLTSAVILGLESRRNHDQTLLSQTWESPNLEDQVLILTSPRNRVAQSYPPPLPIGKSRPRLLSQTESHGTHEHILLFLFLRLPQSGGPGSCIHFPKEQGQLRVQVQVILWLTVSRPVRLGVLLLLERVTRCYIPLSDIYFLFHVGPPHWQDEGSVICSAMTQVQVTLRLTVCQPVCLGARPPMGSWKYFNFLC
jgi:hypothetical protein